MMSRDVVKSLGKWLGAGSRERQQKDLEKGTINSIFKQAHLK